MLEPELQALKLGQRDLVRAAGGGETAAGFCRVGQQRLSAYGNINLPDEWMPVDVVFRLEAVTHGSANAPHVTRLLAANAGFALVPLPEVSGIGKSTVEHLACVAKEAGETIAALAGAIARGKSPTDAQRRDLAREFDEGIRAMVEARHALLQGREG